MRVVQTTPASDEPTATPWIERHPDRLLWTVVVGMVLAFAIAVPVAIVLDRTIDRARPMYDDILEMSQLQYDHARRGKPPVALVVGPGGHARVGRDKFTPHDGVTIEVRVDGREYCVRGTTTDGDASEWECGDGTTPPE